MKPIYAWPLVIASATIMFGGTYLYNANKVHPPVVKPVVHQPVAPKVIVKQQTQEVIGTAHATPKPISPYQPLDLAPPPDTTPPPTSTSPAQPKTCNSYTAINPQGWPQTKEVCSDGTTTWR